MSAAAEETTPSVSRLELWRGRVDYQGIILGVVCTLVTLLLLIGARMTAEAIALRLGEDRLANLNQVLPAQLYDNNPLEAAISVSDSNLAMPTEVFVARQQGEFRGAAFQTSTQGYGGPIGLMIGVDADGNVLGVRVLSHKETPGLADKIEIGRSSWIESFNGHSLTNTTSRQWAVKKDGGDFDQFTGATITPRAMVKGVYEGLQFYARNQDAIRVPAPVTSEQEK